MVHRARAPRPHRQTHTRWAGAALRRSLARRPGQANQHDIACAALGIATAASRTRTFAEGAEIAVQRLRPICRLALASRKIFRNQHKRVGPCTG